MINILMGFLVSIIAIISLAWFYVNTWKPFVQEKAYIKMEISRSTGTEREHWEGELKKLYFAKIPLMRYFLVKKS